MVAQDVRSYERQQLILLPDHRLVALASVSTVEHFRAGTGISGVEDRGA
jgi:hypothetical protein